ncbi:MAG: extracellular solute-binding protein [Lachnospiraceae bacterium]|nr:extracellular solute-binding protein [Lachnospiraceae bacterium]
MRKPMAKKVLAATMAAAMTMSVAACGNTAPAASTEAPAASTETPATSEETPAAEETPAEEEEVSKYTVLKDADGNVYDLGGMEIVIRDWFSSPDRAEAKTDFEEAQYEYQDWVQETYNFKIHSETIGDWGSVVQDFVDYATAGGDDNNYVFTLRNDPAFLSAISSGLVYDLSTIDCLDFDSPAMKLNHVAELYTMHGSIYAMRSGNAEPRTGIYFNRRILQEAGVNPDDIYDMQANDTWTWDAFTEILEKVQQDTDNDGTIDIWGIAVNEGVMTTAAIFSNGGQMVGVDASGNYTYEFENPNTLEALEWCRDTFTKYDWNGPEGEDGSAPSWDYYQGQFKNGGAAFFVDQQYCATPGNLLYDMEDELGFVMFPKGPKGSMCQTSGDNSFVLPSCYDADRAWKIAFAYSVYTDLVPGYEDYNAYINTTRTGNFDSRAAEETVPAMIKNEVVDYSAIIPNLDTGAPFLWVVGPNCAPISEIADGFRDMYKQAIEEANK